jgi:predicted hotdog family 3-hydroxylacyl-ACP dehydratase
MTAVAGLIPHAGSMCLLDRVVTHSELAIECTATSHSSAANALRSNGQLAALHLIEYAAQAMAAHGAIGAGGVQRGMLASVRDVRLHVGRIDDIDTELSVRATRRIAQTSGSIYDFSIRGGGLLLCEGRIAIVYL